MWIDAVHLDAQEDTTMLHPEAPLYVRALLAIHILAGTAALIVAPVAMIVLKGGKAHRIFGRIFVAAMGVVAASALVIAPWFGDWFLLAIAVFSAYLAFSGWRILARKRGSDPVAAVDWGAAYSVIAAGVALFVLASAQRAHFGSFVLVLAVFGTVAIALGTRDLVGMLRPAADSRWLIRHFTNMTAAYIATVTAFSSVNFTFIEPLWLRWLWPTVAGSVLITYWTIAYRPRTRIRSASRAASTP